MMKMSDTNPNPAITASNDLVKELKLNIKRYNSLLDKYRKGILSDKQVVYQLSRLGKYITEIGKDITSMNSDKRGYELDYKVAEQELKLDRLREENRRLRRRLQELRGN